MEAENISDLNPENQILYVLSHVDPSSKYLDMSIWVTTEARKLQKNLGSTGRALEVDKRTQVLWIGKIEKMRQDINQEVVPGEENVWNAY